MCSTLRRGQSYELVKNHKPRFKTFEIDSKASQLGFKILRLPPYHCQYNAIEMVWAALKGYVKDRNNTFKLKDIEKLFMEAISTITPEKWISYVDHVKRVLDADWASEGLNGHSVQELIISLCPGDSEDTNESED